MSFLVSILIIEASFKGGQRLSRASTSRLRHTGTPSFSTLGQACRGMQGQRRRPGTLNLNRIHCAFESCKAPLCDYQNCLVKHIVGAATQKECMIARGTAAVTTQTQALAGFSLQVRKATRGRWESRRTRRARRGGSGWRRSRTTKSVSMAP